MPGSSAAAVDAAEALHQTAADATSQVLQLDTLSSEPAEPGSPQLSGRRSSPTAVLAGSGRRHPEEGVPPLGVGAAAAADDTEQYIRANETVLAAAAEAMKASVASAAAEAGRVAAQQASAAATIAAKAETEELAQVMTTLLVGCRTELKRLADAFGVLVKRRETADNAVRTLCVRLQGVQKQQATESLASVRRLSGVTAAIETLASVSTQAIPTTTRFPGISLTYWLCF